MELFHLPKLELWLLCTFYAGQDAWTLQKKLDALQEASLTLSCLKHVTT